MERVYDRGREKEDHREKRMQLFRRFNNVCAYNTIEGSHLRSCGQQTEEDRHRHSKSRQLHSQNLYSCCASMLLERVFNGTEYYYETSGNNIVYNMESKPVGTYKNSKITFD